MGNGQYVTYYALFYSQWKVAAWIIARRGNELKRKDARQDTGAVHALSLAGTAQSTHVYGCVVFDLTLLCDIQRDESVSIS